MRMEGGARCAPQPAACVGGGAGLDQPLRPVVPPPWGCFSFKKLSTAIPETIPCRRSFHPFSSMKDCVALFPLGLRSASEVVGVGKKTRAVGPKKPAPSAEKNPRGGSGKRKSTLRLIRLLENPRTCSAPVGRWKTGARPARRPEKHAPPPGPLGLWVDWDAARYA